jgi:hypothetical protein
MVSVSIPNPPARLCLLVLAACTSASAQSPQVVCDHGIGHFEATYLTGVRVRVAPVKSGAFATRACEAELRSGTNRTVAVPSATQIDIDVLGADLGFGLPVVAFVVQPTQGDPRKNYEIWSLEKKPRSLHTLSGENSYRASDAAFNGQVAIWTTDSVAMQPFENPSHTDDLSPPNVALRFDHGRLLDVSSWYRPHYDHQITLLRSQLTAAKLTDLRNSGILLTAPSVSEERLAQLRRTQATILEIVRAFLYSGRPESAWAELQPVWPTNEVPRIKSTLLAGRARGIEAVGSNADSLPLPPN